MRLTLQHFFHMLKTLFAGGNSQHLPAKERAQVAPLADHGHGNIREPNVAWVDLTFAGRTAAFLGRLVASRTGGLFVGAKAVHQVAEVRAGARRGPARLIRSHGLQLNQRAARIHPRPLVGIEQLQIVGPHQFHVANWARVIQHDKKVLEQLQVLLEFLFEGLAQIRLLFLHFNSSPRGRVGRSHLKLWNLDLNINNPA